MQPGSYIRHLKPEAFPDDEILIDEGRPNPPRFDLPLSLEGRGITSQETWKSGAKALAWYQGLLWSKATIAKNSIAAKLRTIGRLNDAITLEECHTHYTVAQCKGCSRVNKFPNRCENKHCPECQPRMASDREKAVDWWVKTVSQPKLVTLTVKNITDFSKGHVTEFQSWFGKLRRRAFAKNWTGGFYSLEVTKEYHGWHLHLHALVDARWIDQAELSNQWRSVTNGAGYIVDVRDARAHDYQRKVKKYVVKGTALATWTADEIATFIDAFTGKRTFGVFGSLYGKRTEFSEWWKETRKSKPVCECGCCEAHYMTEAEFLEKDLRPNLDAPPIPPPGKFAHPEFPTLTGAAPFPR